MSAEKAKNRLVGLGLYGCGNRTRALLDSLYGEGEYQVVACYDLRVDAMQAVVERYEGRTCATAEELVNYEEVDAFLISLDPFAHPDAFRIAAEAGKPIFIEKPVAMTAKDAYHMMQKAEAKGIPVQVGFMRRFLPEQVAAHKLE